MRRQSNAPDAGSTQTRGHRPKLILAAVLAVALVLAAFMAAGAAAAEPTVTIEDASSPSYLTAQVKGTVDTGGEPTTYRFQYATQADFSDATTGIEAVIEGPSGEQTVEGELTGLAPNITYHLRLLAENAESAGVPAEAQAPDTFTTLAVQAPTLTINDAATVTATSAEASGTVELAQNDPAFNSSCVFEYASAEDFSGATAVPCEPGAGTILATEPQPVAVNADLANLSPGTTYHLRLIAANAGGTEQATAPDTFTTEATPPQIDATFAGSVSGTAATLGTQVNPGGAPTTVHFDYITLQQYEEDGDSFGAGTQETPESAQVGSDVEDHTVETPISGLSAATAYRYRVIATNEKSPAGLPGPTKMFTTASPSSNFPGECPANETLRRENNSTQLPDCRAYEQVSPPVKDGSAAISPLPFIQFPAQAAPSGEGVVYMGNGPFPGAPANLFPNAHLSARGSAGWGTTDITPSSGVATPSNGLSAGATDYSFSEDLSQRVVKVVSPPRTPSGEQLYNLFLVRGGGSSLLNSLAPTEFAPEGSECYEHAECFSFFDLAAFAGASSNFDHILFETNDSLEGTGALGGFVANLYESAAGQVHLVGILPDGTIAPGGAQPGAGGSQTYETTALAPYSWFDVNHAISADGSRVLFSAASDEGEPNEAGQGGMTELYDRIEGNETVEVSAPAPGATPANPAPQPARYRNASADGSLVFFTSSAELTTASNTGVANQSEDLYRYDVDTETLTDLTVDTNPLDAETGAAVQGVSGVSEDGSYVYFVANGELIPGVGEDGRPNLYLSHEDPNTHATDLRFIATLAEGDSADWTATPAFLRAYATPDGAHLAFTSLGSLTGYDNHDRLSGQPDTEIYEYSADTDSLVCASCDPSGAAPTGGAFIGAGPGQLASTAFHQPRVLSDDGARLFFSSPDPLLPGNAIASTKLYEYEQPGSGSCAGDHGCLYRISSGSSGAGGIVDIFLDADASGSNVFFATASRLAPTDRDGLLDVYDARALGGFPALSAPSSCAGGACSQTPSAAPDSTGLGSASYSGAGNVRPHRAPRKCGHKPKRSQRRKCRASAHKSLGRGK